MDNSKPFSTITINNQKIHVAASSSDKLVYRDSKRIIQSDPLDVEKLVQTLKKFQWEIGSVTEEYNIDVVHFKRNTFMLSGTHSRCSKLLWFKDGWASTVQIL